MYDLAIRSAKQPTATERTGSAPEPHREGPLRLSRGSQIRKGCRTPFHLGQKLLQVSSDLRFGTVFLFTLVNNLLVSEEVMRVGCRAAPFCGLPRLVAERGTSNGWMHINVVASASSRASGALLPATPRLSILSCGLSTLSFPSAAALCLGSRSSRNRTICHWQCAQLAHSFSFFSLSLTAAPVVARNAARTKSVRRAAVASLASAARRRSTAAPAA